MTGLGFIPAVYG